MKNTIARVNVSIICAVTVNVPGINPIRFNPTINNANNDNITLESLLYTDTATMSLMLLTVSLTTSLLTAIISIDTNTTSVINTILVIVYTPVSAM